MKGWVLKKVLLSCCRKRVESRLKQYNKWIPCVTEPFSKGAKTVVVKIEPDSWGKIEVRVPITSVTVNHKPLVSSIPLECWDDYITLRRNMESLERNRGFKTLVDIDSSGKE